MESERALESLICGGGAVQNRSLLKNSLAGRSIVISIPDA